MLIYCASFSLFKAGEKHRTLNKVNKLVFARKADKVLMENMFEESQSKNNVYLASFSSMTNIGLQNFSVINVFLEITEFNANQKAFHVNKFSTKRSVHSIPALPISCSHHPNKAKVVSKSHVGKQEDDDEQQHQKNGTDDECFNIKHALNL